MPKGSTAQSGSWGCRYGPTHARAHSESASLHNALCAGSSGAALALSEGLTIVAGKAQAPALQRFSGTQPPSRGQRRRRTVAAQVCVDHTLVAR